MTKLHTFSPKTLYFSKARTMQTIALLLVLLKTIVGIFRDSKLQLFHA